MKMSKIELMQHVADQEVLVARNKLDDARTRSHDLLLIATVLDVVAKHPDAHTIIALPYDDEPNSDGRWDVGLTEVLDAERDVLDDSGFGVAAVGNEDGTCTWDWAMDDDHDIVVATIMQRAREMGLA